MIKAKLNTGSIVFGLSRLNIEKLMEGKPIKLNLTELELEDREVLIFFGETEESMYEAMMEGIDIQKTEIRDQAPDPQGEDENLNENDNG